MPSLCTNIEPRSSSHSNYEVEIHCELDSEGECFPTRVLDWKGFKLVGDNIDKSIHPSFQRYRNSTNSFHYFHYYALLDRLDLSKCLESIPTTALNLQQLLVNANNIQQIENDAIVFFSRILTEHLDDYRSQSKNVTMHIPCKYSKEMSSRSLVGIHKILFRQVSQSEKGTLSQLKVLINYSTNIDPAKNLKAFEDFLLIILHAHVIAAAKSILSSPAMCYESVEDLAKEIVVRFLYLDPNAKIGIKDKKCLYAMQVLTLGLIWHGFDDSVKEGDGDRLFIYWKFFMLMFKVARYFNYFKESVILQLQYNFLFPQRQAEQLKWSRFVNSKGNETYHVIST